MIRYYYICVDLKSGLDAPERSYNTLYAAEKDYNGIEIGKSIIYKSLSAYDDKKGSYLIKSEG